MRRASRQTAGLAAIRAPIYFLLLLNWLGRMVLAQQRESAIHLSRVGAPCIVVSDMDRAVAFYSEVLTFQKVSDVEVFGDAYEHLEGLFGIRVRVVQLRL